MHRKQERSHSPKISLVLTKKNLVLITSIRQLRSRECFFKKLDLAYASKGNCKRSHHFTFLFSYDLGTNTNRKTSNT